jgi:hypothetical protein
MPNIIKVGGGKGYPLTITAGDTPVNLCVNLYHDDSMNLAATSNTVTIFKAGTYRFKWGVGMYDYDSSGGVTRLYQNGIAIGEANSFSKCENYLLDVICAVGDVITVYLKTINSSDVASFYLVACINWDNDFND